MSKRGPKNIEPKIIQKIRNLYEAGNHTQANLAAKYNLSQSTICKIVNNYIHKDSAKVKRHGHKG